MINNGFQSGAFQSLSEKSSLQKSQSPVLKAVFDMAADTQAATPVSSVGQELSNSTDTTLVQLLQLILTLVTTLLPQLSSTSQVASTVPVAETPAPAPTPAPVPAPPPAPTPAPVPAPPKAVPRPMPRLDDDGGFQKQHLELPPGAKAPATVPKAKATPKTKGIVAGD